MQINSVSDLLAAQDVARLLRCSVRHVRRLADSGRMPRPVRLGRLVRWSRGTINRWIESGCSVSEAVPPDLGLSCDAMGEPDER